MKKEYNSTEFNRFNCRGIVVIVYPASRVYIMRYELAREKSTHLTYTTKMPLLSGYSINLTSFRF